MIVRELLTRLGVDVDNKKIADFDSKIKQLKGNLSSLSLGFLGLSAVAIPTALLAMAKATAEMGDRIEEHAQSLGLTTDAYQELSSVAAKSGTSIEGVGLGFRAMSKLLEDARGGGKSAVETLNKLGMSAGNLTDAEVWTSHGYLYIKTDVATWRLSLDPVPK